MTMATHNAAAGLAASIPVQAYNPDTGDPWSSRWESGDTLAAVVWPGDDLPATFAPTAAWVSAAAGTLTISWAGSATTAVAPGRYRLRVTATDATDSRVYAVHDAWLKLDGSPGTGTAAPVYCTYDDMLKEAPGWLEKLQKPEDQALCREQRGEARVWVDQAIQRHYRGAGTARQDSLDHLLGGPNRDGRPDVALQAWLDDDRLVLTTPDGKRLVKAAACYAVHLVCEGQVGTGETSDTYRKLSARYRRKASEALTLATAGIDTTDPKDGVADLWVDLGTVDRLRG